MRQRKSRSEASAPDDAGAARDKAIELLARREHSRRELTDKLAARGFEGATIAGAIDRLAAEGLQSEQRFAESFVNARLARGYGELRIRAELNQRGIGGDLLSEALAEAEVDWFEQAEQALAKKWRAGVPDAQAIPKALRYLAGRGFTGEQAREAIRALQDNAAEHE